MPEVSLGIIPGYGGTQRLARLVGRGRAIELTLTAQMITAEEAHRIGLVNRVVPQGGLDEALASWADELLKNGPLALSAALEAIQHGLEMTLDEGMGFEANVFGVVSASEDMREGLQAFLEKRKPEFKNR